VCVCVCDMTLLSLLTYLISPSHLTVLNSHIEKKNAKNSLLWGKDSQSQSHNKNTQKTKRCQYRIIGH